VWQTLLWELESVVAVAKCVLMERECGVREGHASVAAEVYTAVAALM
jgi:hypothetical protein